MWPGVYKVATNFIFFPTLPFFNLIKREREVWYSYLTPILPPHLPYSLTLPFPLPLPFLFSFLSLPFSFPSSLPFFPSLLHFPCLLPFPTWFSSPTTWFYFPMGGRRCPRLSALWDFGCHTWGVVEVVSSILIKFSRSRVKKWIVVDIKSDGLQETDDVAPDFVWKIEAVHEFVLHANQAVLLLQHKLLFHLHIFFIYYCGLILNIFNSFLSFFS